MSNSPKRSCGGLSVWRSLATLELVAGLASSLDRAVEAGRVDRGDADRWVTEQRGRDTAGEFYADAEDPSDRNETVRRRQSKCRAWRGWGRHAGAMDTLGPCRGRCATNGKYMRMSGAATARTPGYDTFYWYYNEPSFLEFVPPPRGVTLDVGCGEGRLGRALLRAGHHVLGMDGSTTLARLAANAEPPLCVAHADAGALPFRSGIADLVVSFMVLMDVEDLDTAVAELARVLAPDGVICVAILHPINTAGTFLPDDPNRTFYLGSISAPCVTCYESNVRASG